jgi:hypothetical protein
VAWPPSSKRFSNRPISYIAVYESWVGGLTSARFRERMSA